MVISSVDLPEPEGPTSPTASPRPTASEMPFRTCTRAGPRPRLRSTASSVMAASVAAAPVLRASVPGLSVMGARPMLRGSGGPGRGVRHDTNQ